MKVGSITAAVLLYASLEAPYSDASLGCASHKTPCSPSFTVFAKRQNQAQQFKAVLRGLLALNVDLCPYSHPRYAMRQDEIRHHILNPYPAMHSRYLVTRPLQSSCGSSAFDHSMHSSRMAFSSLHTQQGLGRGGHASASCGVEVDLVVSSGVAVVEAAMDSA